MEQQIVVIDDEPSVLELLSDALEMEGYSVVCLDRPEDPETLKQKTTPSLFLIDLMLPGTTGIAVASAIRATDFEETPLVAMSASSAMIRSAEASGLFKEVISKPFDINEMVSLVQRCTE